MTKQYIQKMLLVALLLFAVGVNTVQGLYNPITREWNAHPNIDYFPEYRF